MGGRRYSPAGPVRSRPTWIALHGITRNGVEHPSLDRFSRALAASGAHVLVPEVPEWKDLRTAPEAADATVQAAVRAIDATAELDGDRIGVVGFSFGAPQAILASRAEGVSGRVSAVAGFGGYADLAQTFYFMVTGLSKWGGRTVELAPDPYGRWIVAGNSLTRVPGLEEAEDVAAGLLSLAREAGDRAIPSESSEMETARVRERGRIADARLGLWDLLAPPPGAVPRAEEAMELAQAFGQVAATVSPRLDPRLELPSVRTPVHLVHGRTDRLIPYPETLRTARLLPDEVVAHTQITGLFEHSQRAGAAGAWAAMREVPGFTRSLSRVLSAV